MSVIRHGHWNAKHVRDSHVAAQIRNECGTVHACICADPEIMEFAVSGVGNEPVHR